MVADTHVEAISVLNACVQLKGVFARGQEAAKAYAERAAGICGYQCDVYQSIEAVANDPELDFVILATPPNARVELIKLFAAAKLPILLEKPIERTLSAATEVVELCEDNGVLLGMVFQHRARAASRKLQEMIGHGELGPLGLVNIEAPLWRPQAYYDEPGRGSYARDGGGVLLSQAIHTLDLALSMAGDVVEVQAIARTTRFHDMESEDFVSAGLSFANGASGSLLATTANFPGKPECITLHFDQAVARLERAKLHLFWRNGKTEVFGEEEVPVEGVNGSLDFKSTWHGGVISNFADSIRYGSAPLVSGREGLKVHRLIEALVASSEQKRAIVV